MKKLLLIFITFLFISCIPKNIYRRETEDGVLYLLSRNGKTYTFDELNNRNQSLGYSKDIRVIFKDGKVTYILDNINKNAMDFEGYFEYMTDKLGFDPRELEE